MSRQGKRKMKNKPVFQIVLDFVLVVIWLIAFFCNFEGGYIRWLNLVCAVLFLAAGIINLIKYNRG